MSTCICVCVPARLFLFALYSLMVRSPKMGHGVVSLLGKVRPASTGSSQTVRAGMP